MGAVVAMRLRSILRSAVAWRTPIYLLAVLQLGALSVAGADPFKDDAYICLRYARNLIDGLGLVFNAGERVEGFTDPLWTLASAALLALNLPEVIALKALGALCFMGLIRASERAAVEAGLPGVTRWAVPLLVAASTSIAYWSLSGLETVAFAWALMEGARRYVAAARAGVGGTAAGAAWLGVATLLRPEAAASFVVLAGLAAVLGRCRSRSGTAGGAPGGGADGLSRAPVPPSRGLSHGAEWRSVLASILPFVVLVGAWEVFRLRYYGAWLPNTFYAKVEEDPYVLGRGLRYLAGCAVTTPLVPLVAPLLVAGRRWRRPEVALPGAIALLHLAYVVAVGGDYLAFGRFVVPVLAPLALAWASVLAEARRVAASLTALTAIVALAPYVTSPGARAPDYHLSRYRDAAAWLRASLPPGALVATPAIGAIGYLGNTRILDTLGIADPYLARHRDPRLGTVKAEAGHARGDGAYILERAPDVILLANVWMHPIRLEPRSVAAHPETLTLSDRLLLGMPAFLQRYQIVNYRLEDGRWFGMAVRRDSPWHPDHPSWRGPRPE
jgi:hypothetical protein